MDSLFPTAKIYSPFGQTYEAVDRNLLLSYKESERGQILHEGISEAGAMGSVIAAGTLVRHARHAHDPGVRVLLDVRLAAHRRRDVGARRPAGPRLPAGGHGGPDDADRRGAAAQRRALGAARVGVRGVRLLRPGVGVRGRGDHEGRAAPDVRRDGRAPGRREHLLLPHRLQRAVPAAARAGAGRARGGHPAGHVPVRGRSVDGRAPGSSPPGWPCRGRCARGSCWRRTGAWPRTCGRSPRGPSCAATPWPPSRTTCCTPTRSRGRRT